MDDIHGKPNIETFSQYLIKQGLSKLTFKNYESDVNSFYAWMKTKLREFGVVITTLEASFPYLNTKTAAEYKNFLIAGRTPVKTINRRLSTLRQLARYLMVNTMLSTNFMGGIQNISVYMPKKDRILRIKATSPYFGKQTISSGTSGIVIELDKPLQATSQINIWITDSVK